MASEPVRMHPHGTMIEGAICISCQTVLLHHILRDDDRVLFAAYACPNNKCIRFGLYSSAWAMKGIE